MKNLFLLPTDKPSRLYLFEERLILGDLVTVVFKNSGAVNQHIYITNDEKIKDGDWFIEPINKSVLKLKDNADKLINSIFPTCKKIILTTDQDLIKDGVQAIDDEFLEWFVNNPTCEEVEVKKAFADGSTFGYGYIENLIYKIIIQKEEEPKKGSMSEAIKQVVSNQLKQETLEEAKQNYLNKCVKEVRQTGYCDEDFEQGAKWQQEQEKNKYSGEEVDKLLDTLLKNNMCSVAGDELIKEFKNK